MVESFEIGDDVYTLLDSGLVIDTSTGLEVPKAYINEILRLGGVNENLQTTL